MTQHLGEVRYEERRGCGYRRAGKDGVGIYLVGDAWGEVCERLPFPLDVCPTCNGGIKFSRGFTWIQPKTLLEAPPRCKVFSEKCVPGHDHQACVVCNPLDDPAGLMWVGKKYYSPASFTAEAMEMGISKRVSAIPRGFEVGKHWIYLAHNKAYRTPTPGIFYVFRPTLVELVIDDSKPVPDKAKALADKFGDKASIVVVKPIEASETQEVAHAL